MLLYYVRGSSTAVVRRLAKAKVVSSNLISRSNYTIKLLRILGGKTDEKNFRSLFKDWSIY